MSPVPIQTAAGPEPRAASSAWRLPWRRRTAILHVFISSPGDCAGERRALRRAILTVSNGEPARSRGILLQPLMWEDLPPGQATPGDLQSGIDALLVRYGLEEYEIYLGLMKTRIGTPTPRSRSGTVEEFETALERRRKTRQPAEILFYFLDGEAPQEAVTTFRDELGNRGFLYRSAASGEALEAAVHVHLARIVEEWFHWRNRLRRQVRHWRGVVLLTGALLILGASLFYMRFDRGAAVRIRATLALQGPPAASVVYARLSPYMWIHGPSVRRDINGAFLANVKGAQSIAVSLGHFEEWTVSAARLPDLVGQGRRWLAPRLERGMEQLGIDLATTQELELWTRAGDCGLWDIDSPVSRRLLTSIAAQRLFEALDRDGSDLSQWFAREARPFEVAGLRLFAGRVLSRAPDFAHWGTIRHRVELLTISRDWKRMEEEATRALQRPDKEFSQPEIATFIRLAPADRIATWLSCKLSQGVEPFVLAQIVDAAAARQDAAPLFRLLELDAAGCLPAGTDTADHIFAALQSRPLTESGASALELLQRLVHAAQRPVDEVLPPLLTLASVERLGDTERAATAHWLIRQLRTSAGRHNFEAAAMFCLGRLRIGAADRALAKEIQDHLSQRTSFGFQVKAALIDAVIERKERNAVQWAAALARLAREQSQSIGRPLADWPVQTAFVRSLAIAGIPHWQDFQQQAAETLRRRVDEPPDFNAGDFDVAAARLVTKLEEKDQLGLLALPAGVISDEMVPGRWERRLYLLGLLTAGDQPLKPAVTLRLLRSPTVAGDLTQRVAALAAAHGNAIAARFFSRELARDPQHNAIYVDLLGRAGATDTLATLLTTWKPASGAAQIRRALAAAEELPREAYCDLVREAVSTHADLPANELWLHGAHCRVQNDRLIAAARRQLESGTEGQQLVLAFGYLAAVSDATIRHVIGEPAARSGLVAYLRRASPFDWMVVAQAIPQAAATATDPSAFGELAAARRILFVDTGPGGQSSSPQFVVKARLASNPLLAIYAGLHQDSVTRSLLAMAASPTLEVDILGSIEDRQAVFAGYCLWLAAGSMTSATFTVHDLTRSYRLPTILQNNHPTLVRGAAAVLLAAGSN